MGSSNKTYKVGDIIQSWQGKTYYQIIEISDDGGRFKIKHPSGETYTKSAGDLDYFHITDLTDEDYNKLPAYYKDYPDHLQHKETVDSLENEEWRDIKIKDLKHSYMVSSSGRVKKIDHYNIKGNENLLSTFGNNSLGIKEKVNLIRNNNEGRFFFIEDLIKVYFTKDVFNEYLASTSIEYKKMHAEIARAEGDSLEEIDLTEELVNYSTKFLKRKMIYYRIYPNMIYSKKPYSDVYDELHSSCLLIEFIEDNKFYFCHYNKIDKVVNNKESPFYKKVFCRYTYGHKYGYTNWDNFKRLITYIKELPKSTYRNPHKELRDLLDSVLTPF